MTTAQLRGPAAITQNESAGSKTNRSSHQRCRHVFLRDAPWQRTVGGRDVDVTIAQHALIFPAAHLTAQCRDGAHDR